MSPRKRATEETADVQSDVVEETATAAAEAGTVTPEPESKPRRASRAKATPSTDAEATEAAAKPADSPEETEADDASAPPRRAARGAAGATSKAKPETEAAPAKGPARRGNGAAAAPARYARPTYGGLRARYQDDIVPALQRQFNYSNPMQIPKVEKVVVNIGLGEAIQNAKALDAAVGDLAIITGQKAIVTRAKRSIAQFRVRTGMPIGAKVTLRGQRMYDFLDRTFSLALPRIRDFRGIPTRSFDGRGNFTLGIREQLVFPEIDYDKIDRLRGLEISIITTARTDEEGHRLLELLGMPFQSA